MMPKLDQATLHLYNHLFIHRRADTMPDSPSKNTRSAKKVRGRQVDNEIWGESDESIIG